MTAWGQSKEKNIAIAKLDCSQSLEIVERAYETKPRGIGVLADFRASLLIEQEDCCFVVVVVRFLFFTERFRKQSF